MLETKNYSKQTCLLLLESFNMGSLEIDLLLPQVVIRGSAVFGTSVFA